MAVKQGWLRIISVRMIPLFFSYSYAVMIMTSCEPGQMHAFCIKRIRIL